MCNLTKHKIDSLDNTPVRCRPYHVSISKREEINKQGHVSSGYYSTAMSPYESPVVLVSKNDGIKRFCVDFRRVEKK